MSSIPMVQAGAAPTTAQVESLVRECSALRGARGRARAVRWIVLLALLAFVGVTCWAFWGLVRELGSPSYLNALTEAARQRMEKRSDFYMEQGQTLVKNVSPAVTEAFTAQFQSDLPAYLKALETEYPPFVEELKREVPARFEGRARRSLERLQAVMAEEIPALGDEALAQRLTDNLGRAFDRWNERYAVDAIQSRMRALSDRWDQFPMAEPRGADEPPLEDRLVAELTDLLEHRLVERDRPASP
jgi:hypothetical protein